MVWSSNPDYSLAEMLCCIDRALTLNHSQGRALYCQITGTAPSLAIRYCYIMLYNVVYGRTFLQDLLLKAGLLALPSFKTWFEAVKLAQNPSFPGLFESI